MWLDGFGLAGYRSVGNDIQYLNDLSKINLIIGKNNSGKSNILRFCKMIPIIFKSRLLINDFYDLNRETNAQNIKISLQIKQDSRYIDLYKKIDELLKGKIQNIQNKQQHWKNSFWITWEMHGTGITIDESFIHNLFSAHELATIIDLPYQNGLPKENLTSMLCSRISQIVLNYFGEMDEYTVLIPGHRIITNDDKGYIYDGTGLIKILSELKDPDDKKIMDRKKFDNINNFLREMLDENSATIEIPHTHDKINVNIKGKVLPLENLGSGIQQLIILATAVTQLENHLICIEEPEIHIHPALQKKFIKYLDEKTNNQYFIATHSNSFFDYPNVNCYHCFLKDAFTHCTLAISKDNKYTLLNDLGYKASDVLITNCIVWVEGPTDRIYLNKWIQEKNSSLIEGVHYSILFYSGMHKYISNDSTILDDLIKLTNINNNNAIIMDSDIDAPSKILDKNKNRICQEFKNNNGFVWVTDGCEIENYINPTILNNAIKHVHGSDAIPAENINKYSKVTIYAYANSQNTKNKINKVKVAKRVIEHPTDFSRYNLGLMIDKLIQYIERCNR